MPVYGATHENGTHIWAGNTEGWMSPAAFVGYDRERRRLEMLLGKKTKAKTSVDLVQRFLNSDVNLVSKRSTSSKKGELFGLELELEGVGLTPELKIPGWSGHADGSLRGASNVEWIFSTPTTYETSIKRVDALFKALNKSKAKLANSYRTSTHIHLNYSDKYAFQVVTLFVSYTMLEDVLTRWCGESRIGNLFCLGARDAENIASTMDDCTFKYNHFLQFNNELRYAGLNLSSLNKFGTVELRTMRGADNPEEVKEWLNIINQLYVFSLNNRRPPSEIVEDVSRLGATGFIRSIFDERTTNLLTSNMNENELHASIYEGLRLIQMFCYNVSNHWNLTVEYKKESVKDIEHEEKAAVSGEMSVFAAGRVEEVNEEIERIRAQMVPLLGARFRVIEDANR